MSIEFVDIAIWLAAHRVLDRIEKEYRRISCAMVNAYLSDITKSWL